MKTKTKAFPTWELWEMCRSPLSYVTQGIKKLDCFFWLKADPEGPSFPHSTGLPGTLSTESSPQAKAWKR